MVLSGKYGTRYSPSVLIRLSFQTHDRFVSVIVPYFPSINHVVHLYILQTWVHKIQRTLLVFKDLNLHDPLILVHQRYWGWSNLHQYVGNNEFFRTCPVWCGHWFLIIFIISLYKMPSTSINQNKTPLNKYLINTCCKVFFYLIEIYIPT